MGDTRRDSKNSVAKAMHKHPSDLFSKRNLIGSDIQRLCAAHDEMEAHPDDPAYDIIPVKTTMGSSTKYTGKNIPIRRRFNLIMQSAIKRK